LRRIADVLRSDDPDLYARFIAWWQPSDVKAMTGGTSPAPPLYADLAQRLSGVEESAQPSLLDLVSYLPEDILTKVDRASMAVSLEVRAPLLDHRVVELALALPMRLKWRDGQSKWLLRRLLERRIPTALIERPKMGFGVPLADWFRGPLKARMDDHLMSDDLTAVGVDPKPVRSLWTQFREGQSHRSDLLWQMLILMMWSRIHLRAGTAMAAHHAC